MFDMTNENSQNRGAACIYAWRDFKSINTYNFFLSPQKNIGSVVIIAVCLYNYCVNYWGGLSSVQNMLNIVFKNYLNEYSKI